MVAGPAGPEADRLAKQAKRLGVALRLLGHVPDPDLKALYQSAKALVFPSLDEGFGFPVLEAMALGLPVVASNAGAIPEVAGDAAALAACDDEDGFASRLGELLETPRRSEELREAGRERARRFSWSAAAERTRDVYEQVLSR